MKRLIKDFIRDVRYAKNICTNKQILLKRILSENITDMAEQNMRCTRIDTYKNLYETLRRNISSPTTVSNARNRLTSTKQNVSESVQSYNMLIKLGKLEYAVQNKHHDPTSKSIAMEEEEENATHICIHNLPQKSDDFVAAYSSSSTRFELV